MEDILPGAGKTVVHAQHFEIFGNKAIAEVRAQKAGAAGDKNTFILMIFHKNPLMHIQSLCLTIHQIPSFAPFVFFVVKISII